MSTSSAPPPSSAPAIRILFVCLGNICRSPMAHGIFSSLTSSLPPGSPLIRLDSAGTGAYHAGSDPDPRTMSTLQQHGITDFEHQARKVKTSDFWDFDYVLAMDEENLVDLRGLRRRAETERRRQGQGKGAGDGNGDGDGDGLAKLCLFGDYGGRKGEVIDDPWYGGGEGFEVAYKQCVRFSKGLLREILGEDLE